MYDDGRYIIKDDYGSISLDFTIDDIHNIREQNYGRTKDMTVTEKVAYYNNSGKEEERESNLFSRK